MNGQKLGALYHTIDHIAASIMNGMTSKASSKGIFEQADIWNIVSYRTRWLDQHQELRTTAFSRKSS